MRDAERLSDRGHVEQSESTGRGDHRALREFLGIASQGRRFQPAKEYAGGIDGVDSWPSGHYSIGNRSALLHEVQRMPIGKEQVESFMRIERKDIWLHAAHALERTRCAAMQSGIGSANTSAFERGGQCVEPLLFWDSVRDGRVQAQGRFVNKQQHR